MARESTVRKSRKQRKIERKENRATQKVAYADTQTKKDRRVPDSKFANDAWSRARAGSKTEHNAAFVQLEKRVKCQFIS